MQVVILAVGKLKERYWKEALAEYVKRLSGYVQIEVLEVADEPALEKASSAQLAEVKRVEGERISKLLKPRDGVVALDIAGNMFDSEAWSAQFQQLEAAAYGRIVFVIGGSHGLDDRILREAQVRWSFGPMTFPHQLARVVLVEQLYRGLRIARGEPYHK